MNTTQKTLLTLATAALLGTPALHARPRRNRAAASRPAREAVVEKFDQNGNAQLDGTERQAAGAARATARQAGNLADDSSSGRRGRGHGGPKGINGYGKGKGRNGHGGPKGVNGKGKGRGKGKGAARRNRNQNQDQNQDQDQNQ